LSLRDRKQFVLPERGLDGFDRPAQKGHAVHRARTVRHAYLDFVLPDEGFLEIDARVLHESRKLRVEAEVAMQPGFHEHSLIVPRRSSTADMFSCLQQKDFPLL